MSEHYRPRKISPDRLRKVTGMTIKEIAELLECRRESIYYALLGNRTKSGLRKKIDNLILEKGNEADNSR